MIETKTVVSVSDMAKMVGLSRARFYQLVGSAFPHPLYDVVTRRPFYSEELQQVCMDVRRRNLGIDGRPLLFYARRRRTVSRPRPVGVPTPKAEDKLGPVIAGINALGLSATAMQVELAIAAIFPSGINGTATGEIVRAVFLHLRKQDA